MVLKNIDGISKKRDAGIKSDALKGTRPKKIDGLIGVKKNPAHFPAVYDEPGIKKNLDKKIVNIEREELAYKGPNLADMIDGAIDTAKGYLEKRWKAAKAYKKSLKKRAKKSFRAATVRLKTYAIKSFILTAWTLGISMAAYLVFSAVILISKPQMRLAKVLTDIIPIPAVITENGVISYNQYQKVASLAGAERALESNLSFVIKNDFLDLYGLKGENLSIEELDAIVMKDEGINETAIARITKIKNEIIKFGFEEVYQKYGDEYNDGEYISREEAKSRFNDSLVDYGGDKLSPVLFGDSGYYIVNVVDNRADPIGIKYVFVKAKTFNEYLESEINRIKYIKLIR